MRAGIRTWVIIAGAACGLLLAGYLDAVPRPPRPPSPRPPGLRSGGTTQTWIVVEVMNPKRDISYEAILSSALDNRTAREQNDYLSALEAWKKDKAQAAANKTKFEEKKPVPGYVQRVETNPATFRNQNEAGAVVAALTRKMQDRKAGK